MDALLRIRAHLNHNRWSSRLTEDSRDMSTKGNIDTIIIVPDLTNTAIWEDLELEYLGPLAISLYSLIIDRDITENTKNMRGILKFSAIGQHQDQLILV